MPNTPGASLSRGESPTEEREGPLPLPLTSPTPVPKTPREGVKFTAAVGALTLKQSKFSFFPLSKGKLHTYRKSQESGTVCI